MSIQASFRENLYKLCWRHFLGKQLVFVKDSLTLFYHSIDRVNSWEYRFDCHRRLILIVSIIIFLVKARFQRFASHRHSKPVLLVCKPALFQILRSSFPLQLHPFCHFLRCFRFEFTWRMTSSMSRFVFSVRICRSVSAKLYIQLLTDFSVGGLYRFISFTENTKVKRKLNERQSKSFTRSLASCHLTGQTKYLCKVISIIYADIIISRNPLHSVCLTCQSWLLSEKTCINYADVIFSENNLHLWKTR